MTLAELVRSSDTLTPSRRSDMMRALTRRDWEATRRLGILVLALAGLAALLAGCGRSEEEEASTARY